MRGLIGAFAFAVAVPLLALACDSSAYDTFGGGGFGGARSGSSGSTTEPEPTSPCDTAHPAYACISSTTCETKVHANASCNVTLECDLGRYETRDGKDDCATSCPAAYTTAAPGACDIPNAGTLICEYDEGTCGCAPVGGLRPGPRVDAGIERDAEADAADADAGEADGGVDASAPVAYEWQCVKPAAGCPRRRPAAGESCVRPMECDYGSCLFPDGVTMQCSGGQWFMNSGCNVR